MGGQRCDGKRKAVVDCIVCCIVHAHQGSQLEKNTVKKLILAMAMIAAISATGPAQADLSIDNFRKMSKGTQTERFGVEMYVGGVVKGYLNANGLQSSLKQPQLFCYSGDFTTGQAFELTKQVVSEHLAKRPADGKEEIIELLLMMKLRQMYPC